MASLNERIGELSQRVQRARGRMDLLTEQRIDKAGV